ncbi:nucleoprotein TPR-like [Planococcus citri]|uniref:nucleoprotein TPR-like n=1 Tax=Planococcus citri TaxID=170843 RepID=UPI0031F9BACE
METEDESDFVRPEIDNNLVISSPSPNAEFCLVFDDDVEERSEQSSRELSTTSTSIEPTTSKTDSDLDAIKRKADEIASNLQKFRTGKSTGTSQDYVPPEEFKRYHETSLFVAQKLKEDRQLFEESKQRSEAVRSKRSHKDISKLPPEEHANFDEIRSLKQKIAKLESTVDYLQDALDAKDRVISEKEESIKSLSESVSNEYAARLNLLEQSQEEIERIKSEHLKSIERINNSKQEYCNQLQIVRQKYLHVENEFKSLDFTRTKLLNKNIRLEEKMANLENELDNLRIHQENQPPVPDLNNYLPRELLQDKLQSVELVLNEFYSYILDNAGSNSELLDDDVPYENYDILKTLEKTGDKLESMFYLIKDKFANVCDLETSLSQANARIVELQHVVDENKQQETKLKKLLASLKAKVQSESNSCKDLTEELSKSKERIHQLEHELSSRSSSEDEWKMKYIELEKLNESISYQLNEMREKVEAVEFVEVSSQAKENSQIDSLKCELARLHEENTEISMLLEMKTREYEVLMVECETLRKAQEDGSSSDKTENDFVVLQKKDAESAEEDWKEKYHKLCEDHDKLTQTVRTMSEKAIEWGNEKLNSQNYQQENQHLQNQYQTLLDQLDAANREISDLSEYRNRAAKEIESLNTKLDSLESQLIANEDIIRDQTSDYDLILGKLQAAEEHNKKLQNEIANLASKSAQSSQPIEDAELGRLKSVVASLENEKAKLVEECDKFKSKYQRLQIYCKANIKKGDKSSDGNTEVEKLKLECKELKKRLEETAGKLQSDNNDELEKLNAENQALQEFCNETRQRIESLKQENSHLLSFKQAHDDLLAANQRLREALQQSQQIGDDENEQENLRQQNQVLNERFLEISRELEQLQQGTLDQGYELDTLREENHAQKSRLEKLEQLCLDKGCQLDVLREENQVQKIQIEDLSQDSSELDLVREQFQAQKLQIEALSQSSSELDVLREQCQAQQSRIEALSKDISELEALREENQVQKSQIESLQSHLGQSPQLENVRRELEWYKQEYQSQSEYIQEIGHRLAALNKENDELKQMKSAIDQQFSSLCEDSRALRDQVDRMKNENQSLDQSNQQLKEFCDKARQQITMLSETSQNYKIEVDSLKERCSELETINQNLNADTSSSDELERLKSENELLVATNEQLMEFCNNAKAKIAELEKVKRMCDELQETVDKLRENYETELADLRNQLLNDDQEGAENEERLALETELALASDKIAGYEEQLVITRDELIRVKNDLHQIRSQVRTSQDQAVVLIAECSAQVAPISEALAQLKLENEQLKEQSQKYNQNASSDRAPRIFDHFRSSSPDACEIAVQCDESFESCVRQMYQQDLNVEREKYNAALALIVAKINDLQECCDKVDREFKEKEGIVLHYKAKIEEERNRYEATIDQLRRSISETAAVAVQKQEAEIQQQSHSNMERYKEVVTEERAKYEQIIHEMQQNLQHYKSLVDEERTKYERIIHEMQENANKLRQARASVEESHFQQPKMDFYDDNAVHRAADEVKVFDMFKGGTETVQETIPNVKKYYDYCKGVIKKEIKDILNPEDDVVGDWASDHVIIDDDTTSAEDSRATPITSRFIDVLDDLVRRFSITTFASDYKFDETIEEFSLAFKLAELFQVVVAYYVDSPRAVENPYALELLKKFRDVAHQVDDGKSPSPVEVFEPSSHVPRIAEEVDTQLLITAKRLDCENRYLLQAISLVEHLIAEYWNFDSPWNLQGLIFELRRNITEDTGIPYYDLSATEADPDFGQKAINEFGEVFNDWKEMIEKHTETLSVLTEVKESDKPAAYVLVDVYKSLETAKNKLHELICDLHYVYSAENSSNVNPVEFFEQIEDINQHVEKSINAIISDESIKQDVANITASSAAAAHSDHDHHHHHSHSHEDLYDESQSDDATSEEHHHHHHDHHDHAHHSHAATASTDNTSAELKALLTESNRKIERLVKELSDVKNSGEYNEMKQLHSKLDETLYQLHLRDVHCVELTQELTQLLSERDSLQIKLSTILRENEQLREAEHQSPRLTRSIPTQSSNLENKLEELQQVNYMKDPRISEASRLHHASQMQLFSEDAAESSSKNKENKESGGFSLFKWITGDTDDK